MSRSGWNLGRTVLLLSLTAVWSGCMCASRPSRVNPPPINPSAAASQAMSQYDTDGDGYLSGAELEAAGSIHGALEVIDTDGDGRVSRAELEEALRKMVDSGVGLMVFNCQVTLDGRPLAGARLEFEPEEFLGGAVLPASGNTESSGMAVIAVDPQQLPRDQRDLSGVVQPGLFRVRITHPEVALPARYNSETTLGQMISEAIPGEELQVFELSSR